MLDTIFTIAILQVASKLTRRILKTTHRELESNYVKIGTNFIVVGLIINLLVSLAKESTY